MIIYYSCTIISSRILRFVCSLVDHLPSSYSSFE
jgi:hypothetical protein